MNALKQARALPDSNDSLAKATPSASKILSL